MDVLLPACIVHTFKREIVHLPVTKNKFILIMDLRLI